MNIHSVLRFLSLTLIAIVVLSAAARAQETTGNISGLVKDQTGATISGATITVTDPARGFQRTFQTTDDGTFNVTDLPASAYTVSVEMAGFKKYLADVQINVNDRRSLDIVLEPGEVSEQVTIVAEPPVVQDSPTQRGLISGDQIRELPLNTRNFVQLALLSAGVNSSNGSQIGSGALSVVQLSINGGRTSSINWLVDGARNVDTGSNLTLLTTPSVDALQEFTILTSNYAPEFGRNGGGVINIVTRSGTNEFHGTMYEFLRNDALNARPPFQVTPLQGINKLNGQPRFKAPLNYNDYGFTIGGPLYLPRFGEGRKALYDGHDKTFFFYSQEWRKTKSVNTAVGTVPTVEQRNGIFAGTIRNPFTGVAFPTDAAGNSVFTSFIDPNAAAILKFIPLPNETTPGTNILNRFRRAVPVASNVAQEILRIDHNFNTNWTIFGRYIQESFSRNDPGGNQFLDPFAIGATAGTLYPNVAAQNTSTPGKNFVVNVKTIISPTMINEVAYDYAFNAVITRFAGTGLRANAPGYTSPELFPGTLQGALPSFTFSGATANFSFVSPSQIENPSHTLRDNVTIAHGAHTFKFGGSFSREQKNENAGNSLNGSYSFDGSRSGNDLADFLLGAPRTYVEDENEVFVKLRYNTTEFYAQDSWKVTPRLTLDYGARYSLYDNPIDAGDLLISFRPDLYNPAAAVRIDPASGNVISGAGDRFNGIIFAGQNSPYGRRVQSSDRKTLGPRIGFAYDLFGDSRTVVRGGFGIYYDRTLVGNVEQNAFANPAINSRATIDNPPLSDPSAGVPRTTVPVISLNSTGDPFRVPRTYQYSLSLQREVFKNAVLEVAYVGTAARNLLHQANINQPVPGAQAALTAQLRANGTIGSTTRVSINAVRPFLGYASITDRRTEAASNYNSLQLTLNKRMSRGLEYGAVYTWSKNLTNASTDRSDSPQDPLNLDAERAPSLFDRTHIFTSHIVYELPFFRKGTKLAKLLLGGFQVTGIYTAQSGTPLTITQTIAASTPTGSLFAFSDPLGTGSTLRPNLIGDPHGSGNVNQWFNTAAFAPAFFAYGSAGRGIVRGPGINNFDLAVFKNFRFSDRVNLQFRSEFFNVLNHPQYLNPGTAATFNVDPTAPAGSFPARYIQTNTTFGVITGTRDPRNIQFGVKLNF
ncbi:MAG TPA: carboxypeptidase regulatory-like domain-containing protein [Pyrinomonadaceae bacterium]|nr:carboxypeptidase regulatory-like domain-containing protein [Pyrinomonadaceae bacterium]